MVSGDLEDGGVPELLRQCETSRITGFLRFEGTGRDAGVSGTIRLYGGQIAVDQEPREDGQDPVDLLLELESADWEVDLSLPPLPVSRGTALERHGSLAVHVPVDLMSYCEHAGLTGTLVLEYEERRAEAVYDGGELLAIELDGSDATDLQEVFAWESGKFRVLIDPEAPRRLEAQPETASEPDVDGWSPAPPQKREDTRQFLRVVEMALADVLEGSERARSPTRTSPPLPPPPKARPRPQSVPPPKRRRRDDQTVKLVFLSGERSSVSRRDEPNTRHVRSDITQRVEVIGTEARPDRRADERKPMAKKRRGKKKRSQKKPSPATSAAKISAAKTKAQATAKEARPGTPEPAERGSAPADAPHDPGRQIATASAWAAGVMLLGFLVLFILANLPPV